MTARELLLLILALHIAALVTAAELWADVNAAEPVRAIIDYTAVLSLLAIGYAAGRSSNGGDQ